LQFSITIGFDDPPAQSEWPAGAVTSSAIAMREVASARRTAVRDAIDPVASWC
jgi:hypothetical protein